MRSESEIKKRYSEELSKWRNSNKGKDLFKSTKFKLEGKIEILSWVLENG